MADVDIASSGCFYARDWPDSDGGVFAVNTGRIEEGAFDDVSRIGHAVPFVQVAAVSANSNVIQSTLTADVGRH
ncbi:hypothetical protein OHB05_42695 [Streptomyces sp. NBC_00638]|uniref:hypothetical protein n=1 Tax=Streptomyces sp. NBC_00638 TaxID=2975794 RepID=UPI00225264C4|nr:hypothetical protein [Streptomyces sp. NBC_00638]MCX5009227.1 hypothetical protein [Streptomyces sp. NBC_00638]